MLTRIAMHLLLSIGLLRVETLTAFKLQRIDIPVHAGTHSPPLCSQHIGRVGTRREARSLYHLRVTATLARCNGGVR